MPASMKSPPVATPCASMTKTAPFRPAVVKLKIPSTTNPRWLTEEYAISFFIFGCTSETSAP